MLSAALNESFPLSKGRGLSKCGFILGIRQADRQTVSQINRQIVRQTNRQINRQVNRQIHIKINFQITIQTGRVLWYFWYHDGEFTTRRNEENAVNS